MVGYQKHGVGLGDKPAIGHVGLEIIAPDFEGAAGHRVLNHAGNQMQEAGCLACW